MLVAGFGIHAFGEPQQLSFLCNYINPAPSLGATPVSPDAYTINDVNNGALGPLLAAGTQTISPAICEWGGPVQNAMWHLVNGFQFIWKYQQRNLLVNELAADVAYFGSYAEAAAAGDSQEAVQRFIRRINDKYGTIWGSGLVRPDQRAAHRQHHDLGGQPRRLPPDARLRPRRRHLRWSQGPERNGQRALPQAHQADPA